MHLNTETILRYLELRNAGTPSPEMEEHLGTCERCQREVSELREMVSLLEADRTNEPPSELLDESIRLFQPVLRPSERSSRVLRIARLVFDGYERPLEGIRSVDTAPRQLLFRYGPVDVDLRLETSGERTSIAGQLLSEADSFPERTEVRLEAEGAVLSTTSTNEVGEFFFEEAPSTCFHLSLGLPEGELKLFCVNRTPTP